MARHLMRKTGNGVYRVRISEEQGTRLNLPWIAKRGLGARRGVSTYITNNRAAAEAAAAEGHSVRGLDPLDSMSSSAGSGRSAGNTWRPSMSRASVSNGSTTTGEALGSHTNSRGISAQSLQSSIGGDGGGVLIHDCVWGMVQQLGPDSSRWGRIMRCMNCREAAAFGCQIGGCGNLTCANCIGEVSIALAGGAGGGNSSRSSSSGSVSRHVRFEAESSSSTINCRDVIQHWS